MDTSYLALPTLAEMSRSIDVSLPGSVRWAGSGSVSMTLVVGENDGVNEGVNE